MRSAPLAFMLALAAAPTAAQDAPAPAADPGMPAYADTRDLVTLPDGRALHFVCMGSGSPTVILNSPATMMANAWSSIQPAFAEITRTCAWDRPGFGLSDGADWAQTVDRTTTDLEAGLDAMGIDGPIVLSGHSYGAYELLLLADRRPEQVAGMVLLDPSIPGQAAAVARLAPAVAESAPEEDPLQTMLANCAQAMRSGSREERQACLIYPPMFPAELSTRLAQHANDNPVLFESVASFIASFEASSEIVINPDRDYGDMPLIVLTAVDRPAPEDATDEMRAQILAFDAEWDRAHDALAGLSSRGVNARVPGGDHNLHVSKRQVVIDAIEAVVREVRED